MHKTTGAGQFPALVWTAVGEAGTGREVPECPCSPSHWDSSPQGWNPLDWAKPNLLPQCLCCQWREIGRYGYDFSNQFGWWRWSFSSASCGRDKIHGFYVAAVCWLCCCTWKAVSEPNSYTDWKWFHFQHEFLLLVSSIFYSDNFKLVALQCDVGFFSLHMYSTVEWSICKKENIFSSTAPLYRPFRFT